MPSSMIFVIICINLFTLKYFHIFPFNILDFKKLSTYSVSYKIFDFSFNDFFFFLWSINKSFVMTLIFLTFFTFAQILQFEFLWTLKRSRSVKSLIYKTFMLLRDFPVYFYCFILFHCGSI